MDRNPLVSVVIPTHNAEKLIAETIESVIGQTYTNWEMIIVDDCSTDSTAEVAIKFEREDERIRLVQLTENFGGPAKPRNVGISNSKGDYVAFCDSDDIWQPSKLQKQIDAVIKKNADFIYTSIVFVNETTKKKSYPRSLQAKNLASLISRNKIPTSSVLVKNSPEVGFDEDSALIGVEDYHLWLTLFKKGFRFHLVNEHLVKYRVLNESLSHKQPIAYLTKRHYAIIRFMVTAGVEGDILAFEFLTGLKDWIKLTIKSGLQRLGIVISK